MKGAVDPVAYQEVMMELRAYTNRVSQSCGDMLSAARTCQATMEEDPAAARSADSLQRAVLHIQEGMAAIQRVISAMQRELEDAQKAAAKADFDN